MIYQSAKRYLEGLEEKLRVYYGSFLIPFPNNPDSGFTLDECDDKGLMKWILMREKRLAKTVRFLSFILVDACREIRLLIFYRLVSFILSSRSGLDGREGRDPAGYQIFSTGLQARKAWRPKCLYA